MRIEARLREVGLRLPSVFKYPSANRTGCIQAGTLLYTSGHPQPVDYGVAMEGTVEDDVPEEEAYRCAQATALHILASVQQQLGSLDRIRQVVKVYGMVNSSPGFQRQFAVVDGASDLYYDLFGPERGQHARSAVGMFELPRGFPIEIEAIFEIES